DLINNIKKLNSDDSITGVIVQLPLPKHIDEQNVINAIDASKDVDGFHPINLGKTLIGMPTIHPATPKGILTLFREYNIDTVGKSIVIIGRSNIVGKPLAAMLMQKGWDATVTLCNSYTNKIDLLDYCYNADIIITAVGIPHFLDKQMISKGVIIIDVGINRIQDENSKTGHKLVGDVNFDDVKNLCDAITPVPGGVGPMTVYSLLENTYNAYINKL
ncbi:MAG: bifunctional 5,10-methylenetetrahydrofolate dehydrogenase/5,10-methenyltetrahydrofolate cyclohydrolase, partial [Clostridia bacterium]